MTTMQTEPAAQDHREAVAVLASALQYAWNEHCDDTGGHPPMITQRGSVVTADFDAGDIVNVAVGWIERKGYRLSKVGDLTDLVSEMDRQDGIHPAGYPATRDGIRLGLAAAQDELDEARQAWRDGRAKGKRGAGDWTEARGELMQLAAVTMRTVREIPPAAQ